MIAALVAAALEIALSSTPRAAEVRLLPPQVRPGDAFLVVVRGVAAPPSASVAGRPLTFFETREGFEAVGGLPIETPAGTLGVEVTVPGGAGPAGIRASLRILPGSFPQRELQVDERFVTPPPEPLQRRIAEDRAAFARAFAQPPSPPLFQGSFSWPRRARVTAHYGEKRTLNGVKPSQHYGLDLAGASGAPVAAANGGEVVMVRDCWASGRTIVLWHGAGLFSTYFHLSRTFVQEGSRVKRGTRIGRVGATGRASGPHLHWGIKVNDLYVDPESMLRLPLAPR